MTGRHYSIYDKAQHPFFQSIGQKSRNFASIESGVKGIATSSSCITAAKKLSRGNISQRIRIRERSIDDVVSVPYLRKTQAGSASNRRNAHDSKIYIFRSYIRRFSGHSDVSPLFHNGK